MTFRGQPGCGRLLTQFRAFWFSASGSAGRPSGRVASPIARHAPFPFVCSHQRRRRLLRLARVARVARAICDLVQPVWQLSVLAVLECLCWRNIAMFLPAAIQRMVHGTWKPGKTRASLGNKKCLKNSGNSLKRISKTGKLFSFLLPGETSGMLFPLKIECALKNILAES